MAKQVLGCIGYSKVGRDIALISDEWAKHLNADLHLLHIRNPSPYAPESSGKLATFIEELDLMPPHTCIPPSGNRNISSRKWRNDCRRT